MRKILLLAVAAFAVPSVSHAQVQLQLGGRVGFAKATGNALEDAQTGEKIGMKDFSLSSQVPLQLDLGFKVSPAISLGGYLGYGFGQVDDGWLGGELCTSSGVDCTGSAWHLGVQGSYTFAAPGAPLVPWVGLSFGRESAAVEASGGGDSLEVKLTGYELGLQLGGDYRVNDRLVVGPYIGLTFGKYSDVEVSATIQGQSGGESLSIDKKAWHQWLGFGLRGQFTL